jgi:D-aspartate ligase
MPAHQAAESRGALVLGANYRGLGIVRSLGRRGVPVWVCRSDEHLVGMASRYVRRRLGWPSGNESRQVDFLRQLAERHQLGGWAVFPSDDETAALLARHRERLAEPYLLAAPSWEAMRVAYDKRLTHAAASELAIDQPRTWFPAGRDDVAAIECDFPAILKPTYKVASNRFTDAKAWRVENRDELLRRYDEARGLVPAEVLMVQELIPGRGDTQLSYAALCDDGSVVASVSAVRLRQQPMDFGKASSYVQTTRDGEAAVAACRLLARLRFTGIVEVEFKRDARDGRAKLLDINARAWGWHTVCARAGVDFPWLQWRFLHGERIEPRTARPDVRWVRMSTDLPTAAGEVRGGRMSWRKYLESLRPPVEFAIYASDDPLPAVVDLPVLAGLAMRRARAGRAPRVEPRVDVRLAPAKSPA